MVIYLASGNAHKCDEIRDLLQSAGAAHVDLRSPREWGGMPPVAEDAETFLGNARLKAAALAAGLSGDEESWVLADDSGLEVDALDGAPGVRSARFAGEHGDDAANNRRLLEALASVAPAQRGARFRCVLVLRDRAGKEIVAEGCCEGSIALGARGRHGFGYDPLFIPAGYEQTLGELGREVKATLSHRARAVEQMAGRMSG